jgi:septum formation protein
MISPTFIPHLLLLVSASPSRQQLLEEAQIPYRVINHYAVDSTYSPGTSLDEYVRTMARERMRTACIPYNIDKDELFVLAAITRGQHVDGTISGVPHSTQEAQEMIQTLRGHQRRVITCFIIEKRVYSNGTWNIAAHHEEIVASHVTYDVPDTWIPLYLEHSRSLCASAALTVAGYGLQFVKHIEGSYSGIMGLPMYELRRALEKMGFWTSHT